MRRPPILGSALLLAVALLSCARVGDAPEQGGGTVRLVRLDPGSLAPLRDPFNAAAESVRVLVMLSPT